MKNRFQVAMMDAAMVSAAAGLCALLLLAPILSGQAPAPGLGQTPLDDPAQAAAQAALAKATFEATASVLTLYDRQGSVVRTVGERAVYLWPALSPDGKRLAVSKRDGIWVFDLSTGAGTRITSDPAPVQHISPVWSPDGSQIAYVANPGGSYGLYRKAANGTGSAELLYVHTSPPPVTDWSADGRFLTFYDPASLYILPLNAVGGAPARPEERAPIRVVRQFRARAGRFSPDGRFLAYQSNQSGRNEIWVRPFDVSAADGGASAAGPWQVSDQGGVGMVTWRGDGKEMYYLTPDGRVMVAEVSTVPAFKSGKPRLLFKAPDGSSSWIFTRIPSFGSSISRDGQQVLVAVPLTKPRGSNFFPRQITVFDRQGKVVRTLGEPDGYFQPMISPDGTRVAAFLNLFGDIRVFDVSTGKSVQVTSSAGAASYQSSPVWSPDGSQLVFFSFRAPSPVEHWGGLYRVASDGTGSEELVYRHELGVDIPTTDWSPDGRFLSFSAGGVLWTVPVDGERKAMELVREEYQVYGARFSPDGRFVAYVSDESDRKQVYVRPFDPSSGFGDAKWQVSKEGGLGLVQWRRDGRELYYLATDGGVMAVDVTTTPSFQSGTPKLLFRAPATFPLVGIFDREGTNALECSCAITGCEQGSISRDGQRFVFAVPQPPRRNEVAVPPGILAKYAGMYVGDRTNWVVTLEGNHLMVQGAGREKDSLFAESETKFFLKAANGDFEFVKDDKGDVKYIFVYRGGTPAAQLIRE